MVRIQSKKNLKLPLETSSLEQAVHETLQFTNTSIESEITLVLSDDKKLQQLNRDFLGIDAPTDVLSFPADFTDPDSLHRYLGDIIISVPRALAQAPDNQNTPAKELILLTVHGTLHLLGYDHATDEEKDQMWAVQDALMSKLT